MVLDVNGTFETRCFCKCKSVQPPQILGLMVVRKMLDMVFSQHDLAWLDDLLPEKEKKKKDDDKKKGKEKDKEKRKPKSDDSEEEVRN